MSGGVADGYYRKGRQYGIWVVELFGGLSIEEDANNRIPRLNVTQSLRSWLPTVIRVLG